MSGSHAPDIVPFTAKLQMCMDFERSLRADIKLDLRILAELVESGVFDVSEIPDELINRAEATRWKIMDRALMLKEAMKRIS